jgi:MoaA/NifB/PqqE/SkfB family radical SAM enzyme
MHFAPQQKLALHPQLSQYMRGEKIMPIGLEISPAGMCNASCAFCFYANTGELGEHRNVLLDSEKLVRVLEDASCMGVKAITWTGGGDPSLHPNICTLLEIVDSLGMEQGMFTNALAKPKYDPALLTWVRVTMTDKPYRPEYIKMLRPAKRLGFAFNYSGASDLNYLMETLRLAEEVQADYVQVRPALKFHGETVDIEPPTIAHPLLEITGYKFEDAKKKHGYAECEGYHFVPFIWEDGNVDVCSYMRKHDGYTLGNIYQDSLQHILDRAPRSVPVHANCQVCCKLNETNKLIHSLRMIEDRNFP